jgi:methyltransferase
MKVLLVEPPVSPFDVPTKIFGLPPPHHLERLAGALTSHHDLRILDMRIEDDFISVLSDFQPEIVGSSCVAANSHLAKHVLKQAKDFNPEIVTVIGGHHPSLMPQDCNESFIDVVVIAEGEETLREIVSRCEIGHDFSGIRGIAYHGVDGIFKTNPRRELMNLDRLPMPARGLTQKYRDRRLYFRADWRPIDCTISSRGCPYKCTFCGVWKIYDGKYRYRDSESIADELETITEPYVCFNDDNTLDHTGNAFMLAETIKQRSISKKYEVYGRSDTIVRYPELVEKWREIGMELLLVGLEACDNRTLIAMNKRTTTEINQKAIEICHNNGVEIAAYLIVDPGFDRDDFKRLSDFVTLNNLSHPVFTILSPFPGTDLYNKVKKDLITESFEIYDFFHTVLSTKLPLDEFYEEFLGLYSRAYPAKKFIKAIFQRKAVLSPRMLAMNFKIRKRMSALRGHHYLIKADQALAT